MATATRPALKSATCRFCGTALTRSFVDLGVSPPSNAYLREADLAAPEIFYPLHAYVCESCFLGSGGGSSLFVNHSLRSGARNTLICPGRFSPIRIEDGAQSPVNSGNTVLPASDPRC